MLFNNLNDETIIYGIIAVIFSRWFTYVFFGKKVKGVTETFVYAIATILNMYRETLKFIPLIFGKNYSGITYYDVKGKSNISKVLIANSITLTPKTLYVSEEEDKLIIHRIENDPKKAYSNKNLWDGEEFG